MCRSFVRLGVRVLGRIRRACANATASERRANDHGQCSGPCRGAAVRGFALRAEDFESGAGGGRAVARRDSLPFRRYDSHQSLIAENRTGAGKIVARVTRRPAIHAGTAARFAFFRRPAFQRGRRRFQFSGLPRRKSGFIAARFAGRWRKADYRGEGGRLHRAVWNRATLCGCGKAFRWRCDSSSAPFGEGLSRRDFFAKRGIFRCSRANLPGSAHFA